MRWRWHPLLFAVYPVVFLFARNAETLPAGVLGRPLLVALAFGLVVWAVARGAARDGARGALLATGWLVLWGAYGHVHEVLGSAGPHRVLLPVWIAAAVWMAAAARRGRPGGDRTRDLSRAATLIGIVLLAWPAVGSLRALTGSDGADPPGVISPLTRAPEYADADLYHIVLDGYGRADVLADLYGLDTAVFLDALRARGFRIVDDARADYTQTLPALAAAVGAPVEAPDRGALAARFERAALAGARSAGCDWTRAFATGYAATELLDADRYLAPRTALNEFERALVASTPAGVALNLVESRRGDVLHRRVVEHAFAQLPVPADAPPRAWTFAHIVAPHPPFVFAPTAATAGAMVPLADGDHVVGDDGLTVAQYRAAYRAQVEAVNTRLLRALDAILANGRRNVVLLHGDHGPGSLLAWESRDLSPEAARERLGVLLAVRMPVGGESVRDAARTPAGAWAGIRAVLAGETPVPGAAPSRHSTWSRPFEFVEIEP